MNTLNLKTFKTKFLKNKTATILIAAFLMISMVASMTMTSNVLAQVTPPAGSHVPTYPYLNVAPNPAGIGQTVTLNMIMAIPFITSESGQNFTIQMSTPAGVHSTLGPFRSDATGGTYTTIVPDQLGNYTFQFFYGGQNMTNGVIADASNTGVVTLLVQQDPISLSSYPITPLPTQWWQTPVTAENVQNWYAITGPWLGYGSVTFAATGGYNYTGNYNPYTQSVMAPHVLWTKVWTAGGVAGGQVGGTESSNYWSTSQYWPKYAPVIMNGIMYSTWFPETTGYSAGIVATDLYTGHTLWTINTTNALRAGMETQWHTVNAYGIIGPYIWTTGTLPAADTGGNKINNVGTQWNMYSANTGQYVLSVVNGTNPNLTSDDNGNMIGYYINSTTTVGTMTTYGNAPANQAVPKTGSVTFTAGNPVLVAWNMSQLLANTWGWSPSLNTVIDFGLGVMWAKPIMNVTDTGAPVGVGPNNPALAINGITNNAIVMTAGFEFNQGYGGQTTGWLLVGAMDSVSGAQLWCHNFTSTESPVYLPFTRTQLQVQNGLFINVNMYNNAIIANDARTGKTVWTSTLKAENGNAPSYYDIFNLKTYNGPNGILYFEGFGGDLWAYNTTTGTQIWYRNTTQLFGNPGIETPYGIWPLWVFSCSAMDNNLAYFAVGHEYNPPLFHGAQLFALNNTDGSLVWSTLDMSVTSTAIANGIILSLNAYDNQIYAFGKGPSTMTVNAPSVGVTTATPITITGTVMDISPGSKQSAIALNFPTGIPLVSDESESHWMEYVYQQQPLPSDVTGVPITISVLDSNNNYRTIGSTTSTTLGTYGFTWTPDIAGNFTIYASFAGSNSYYPSSAATQIYASYPAQATATATIKADVATTGDLMTWILASAIAIIIVIAIVGVLIVMMLKKRA